MRRIIYLLFFFILCVCSLFSEETPEILYQKAETLYHQIPDKTPSIKNIPRYKEISDHLEQIIRKNPEGKELLKETYQLLIVSYDHQAKYPEKHQSMKKYAQLLYPEDKEKQAEMIKKEADRLGEQGEIAEAITIYRIIEKEYSETKIAPEALFQVAKIIEEEERQQRAILYTVEEYKKLIQEWPKTEYAEEACFALVKKYQNKGMNAKAIEFLNFLVKNYPNSRYFEYSMFLLGQFYIQIKKESEARKVWNEYLTIYPEGKYSTIIKTFLKGGESFENQ